MIAGPHFQSLRGFIVHLPLTHVIRLLTDRHFLVILEDTMLGHGGAVNG